MSNAEKKQYLDGMKGFACLFVMVGHYLGIYKYAETFSPPPLKCLDTILNSNFSFILDENVWLYLFFVISGYLCSFGRIESFHGLIKKSIHRFLRLAIPILFSYCIIFIIIRFIGSYNQQTVHLLSNDWYQNRYKNTMTIVDVLLSPIMVLIMGNAEFNSPFWCLRDMYIASLLSYLFTLLVSRNWLRFGGGDAAKTNCYVFLLIFSFFFSRVIFACVVGYGLGIIDLNLLQQLKKTQIYGVLAFLILSVFLTQSTICVLLLFSWLTIACPFIPGMNRVLESKAALFLGRISWGIYAFHFPLICTIGGYLICCRISGQGLRMDYFFSCLGCVVLTFMMAFLFNCTFERLASILCHRVDKLLYRN